MVTFKLIKRTPKRIIYRYYPNGEENKGYGVLFINVADGTVKLKKLAAKDFERVITKEETNRWRESVNAMRVEDGQPEYTQDEWPIETKDRVKRFYADHAAHAIREAYEKGVVLEKGTEMWY